ncbi:MAG: phosphonopyruvate decarboxylase [Defluviitaleaceae bacterium]|nr:phosphonopyruvate decarboxylase [Defluviitaleaceae bacterium]
MKVEQFDKFDFFTGVPDSLLQPLTDWIYLSKNHIVAANEGNAVALAAGYNLATGKIPVVYLQNSGLGNIINPIVSLLAPAVYGIPILFVIGWRGEPGIKDEPQHMFQGQTTIATLESIQMTHHLIDKSTTPNDFENALKKFEQKFANGMSCCFLVKKGAFEYAEKPTYKNNYTINREHAIKKIINQNPGSIFVATTGKISRELYENRISHEKDFLVVGSMGHASSIALGIAHNTDKHVIILDGDGAALMHMGAMATIGTSGLKNITHIILNNAAHESVGGLPTVANKIDFTAIAKACGYKHTGTITNAEDITEKLKCTKDTPGPNFFEIKVAIGSRDNLIRPKETPQENKKTFMDDL